MMAYLRVWVWRSGAEIGSVNLAKNTPEGIVLLDANSSETA